jgi:hypothetical protein
VFDVVEFFGAHFAKMKKVVGLIGDRFIFVDRGASASATGNILVL